LHRAKDYLPQSLRQGKEIAHEAFEFHRRRQGLVWSAGDDGVVTLNDKIARPSLRAALAAGAMEKCATSRSTPRPIARLMK